MDLARHCRDIWEHAKRYDEEDDRLYGRLVAFTLDHEHYASERGFDKRTRRMQPKTLLLFDLVRHKVASLMKDPIRVVCLPRRKLADMAPAELAARVIEQFVRDKERRYRVNETRAVWGGIAAGRGVMWLSWEKGVGARVENTDPRLTHVAPGWLDHHDPCCPWVGREMMVSKQWLERTGWTIPAGLRPSDERREREGQVFRNPDEQGEVSVGETEPRYRIVRIFFRDDPRGGRRKPIDLPREDWFLSGPGGDIPVPLEVDAADFASMHPDHILVITKPPPAYKRLCVVFYADHHGPDGIAWEGEWTDGAPNEVEGSFPFPVFIYGSYSHPLRAIGLNDSYLNHTLQQLDDGTMRQAWEQTRQISTLVVMEKGALKDADGFDFRLTDAPVQVAYAPDAMAAESTKVMQAGAINPAIGAIRDMVAQAVSRFGTGDIAMPANRSRDVAGVTMQALQTMGDLPLELHKQSLDDERSMFLTSYLCMWSAYTTDEEVIQYQDDNGDTVFAGLRGSDITPMRVMVGANPDWQVMDAEKVQAIAQFVGQIASIPGGLELMPALALEAGFKESTVRMLQGIGAAIQARAEAQPTGGGAVAAP